MVVFIWLLILSLIVETFNCALCGNQSEAEWFSKLGILKNLHQEQNLCPSVDWHFRNEKNKDLIRIWIKWLYQSFFIFERCCLYSCVCWLHFCHVMVPKGSVGDLDVKSLFLTFVFSLVMEILWQELSLMWMTQKPSRVWLLFGKAGELLCA